MGGGEVRVAIDGQTRLRFSPRRRLREDVLASYKAEDRTKLKNAIKVSKITRVELTPADDGQPPATFTMTCGATDYPFRADDAAEAATWVAIISKRMARPNP